MTTQAFINVEDNIHKSPTDMISPKCFLVVLLVCYASGVLCKPTESSGFEGRGIGSTIWDWITYPFYWWNTPDKNNEQVVSTTRGPYDNVQVGNRNITVWCNDHTCTTMKCDRRGCSNVTCNIYDTDINGECRIYNTSVGGEDKPITPEPPTEPTKPDIPTQTESIKEEEVEKPLELEAALSLTVPEKIPSKTEVAQKKAEPNRQNKV